MTVTKESVIARLKTVNGPDFTGNIVDLGMVSEIFIADSKVFFSITVPAARAQELEPLRAAAERAVKAIPGIASAVVALTAEKKGGGMEAPVPPRPAAPRPAAPQPAQRPAPQAPASHSHGKRGVPGIDAIIAVASGKGGVGKSTTAVNLALGLAANGLKVGVLDADIYGPSMPRLLNIHGRPQTVDGKILKPMQNYGLKVMSMGFLVDEETPMIWRGPMVMSALTQMLREVEWGPLDVLVVDMPPGTGDAQLTMAQQVPLAGAVIVSTPQDLALIDARKGLNMFKKVDVPLLGIVENMSYFLAPDTGKRYDIFGHGGARREAERLGVTFLGEVPLEMGIRESSDAGAPVVASKPDGAEAKIYRDVATKVWDRVQEERGAAEAAVPSIVFD
ncbi:iron-sulfur cluster carrier protein ApbC [Mesorhizobium sp. M2D.F.Ca.ET.185.01.1.1]|uniref:Mrp/NBP35 family ATP-binding protein n=1 Tax=unclassified Mesorhizobium TaxID=325217 RepID=UPI000FCAE273|nr:MULTISPECIES: Mrp/NBP35 family ATP-binding protein [unclassified Mesorhizobium]TGP78151.1 iron-sulfur cluster carrier protein ApbC [bacterium M00.F.Ca.ET.227.01.1.1]TGP88273.1 iron-sulfur cluster carrier protein ApbC [bacterium M00.F.Ca.ET.221.01.1.1]TGP93486.1 iron-sulfur cluster carrier protein ApbC [bacterium M00.F.Ca.ET.222.01.1.1]TGU12940.1 iron-sulfur cluster carrier protein ApbC [bacterium M00.F.Ca.ET.163.01.1.1]TGU31426.1 iron-sulfur cluster carrier protein ApbC [bacterium M00.F.Ca.